VWSRIRHLMLGLVIAFGLGAGVQEEIQISSASPNDVSGSFELIFEKEGKLRYEAYGDSFKGIEKKIHILDWGYGKNDTVERVYFIWGGEVKRERLSNLNEFSFITPQGRMKIVKADMFVKSRSGGMIAFMAAAEISKLLRTPGGYELVYDNVYDNFGGYVIIEVHRDDLARYGVVRIAAGLKRLKPGEMYQVNLGKGLKGQVNQFTTFGGGARGGNGSANSLNGVMISGGEDWNGSSGTRWDVDNYELKKDRVYFDQELLWQIDPLLQWVYPMGAVVSIEKGKGNKGVKQND